MKSALYTLVWNPHENRIRRVWSVLGIASIVSGSLFSLSSFLGRSSFPREVQLLVLYGVVALLSLGVGLIWARYVDRRSFRSYGFHLSRVWYLTALWGLVVGTVGWGGALLTHVLLDWASIEAVLSGSSSQLQLPLALVLSAVAWICVGFWEELVFRGIVLQNAIEGLGSVLDSTLMARAGGVLVSSALFALFHLNQLQSYEMLVFLALGGLVFAVSYVVTGELALPIGLHAGFDIGMTNVFGLTQAGNAGYSHPSVLVPTFTGPEALVGVQGIVNTVWLVIIGAIALSVHSYVRN